MASTDLNTGLTNKDNWVDLASEYKKITHGPTIKPVRTMLKFLDERWPLSKATSILDTGCGTGVVISQILDTFSDRIPESAILRAADFSPAMLDQLKTEKDENISKGNAIWQRLETDVLDAQELQGIEDESVSHVTAGFVFMLVPDPRKALAATRRVLTSKNGGGLLALSCWQGSEWIDLMGLVQVVRPDKKAFPIPPSWMSVDGVKSEMENAGYRDVEAVTVGVEMSFEDHEKVVRFFLAKMPHMRKYAEDMSQEEQDRLEQMMVDKLKSLHPVAPGHMKGTAIVAVGRK